MSYLWVSNNEAQLKQLIKRINDLIENDKKEDLIKLFNALHPATAALIIQFLPTKQTKYLIQTLSSFINPEILSYLSEKIRHIIIPYFANKQLVNMIEKISEKDALEILEDLSEEQLEEIMPKFTIENKRIFETGLSYPETSVGRIMEFNYISVFMFHTVKQVKDLIQALNDADYCSVIFVLDVHRFPVGKVNLITLLKAKDDIYISEIMQSNTTVFNYLTDIEDVTYAFRTYELDYIAIIDEANQMIGVASSISMMSIIYEESRDEYFNSVGLESSDFYDNFLKAARQRVYWVFLSTLGAISLLIYNNQYKHLLASFPEMIIIVPLINNINSVCMIQISTIVINALDDRQLGDLNVKRVLLKEFCIAILNSSVLIIFLSTLLYFLNFEFFSVYISCFTLFLSMIINAMTSTLLPYCLHKMDIDPNLSTSAFLNISADFLVSFIVIRLILYMQ